MRIEDRTIGQLLMMANRTAGLAWRHRLRSVGLTPRRHVILRTLDEDGPLCQKDLAALVCADPTSLSRTVRGLLQAALVCRVDSPGDRRQVILHLTDAGRERVRRAVASGTELTDQMIAGFRPDEVQVLKSMLVRLVDNVPVTAAMLEGDDGD